MITKRTKEENASNEKYPLRERGGDDKLSPIYNLASSLSCLFGFKIISDVILSGTSTSEKKTFAHTNKDFDDKRRQKRAEQHLHTKRSHQLISSSKVDNSHDYDCVKRATCEKTITP